MITIADKLITHLRDGWRSRWWGLLFAGVICIGGWSVVMLIPNSYEAHASVYVNTSSSLAPLLKGLAVESDLSSQLALVKQLLLSRDVLEAVVRENDLTATTGARVDAEVLIADLRKRVELEGGRAARDNLYTIALRDHDPQKALSVVRSLLAHFIERTIGTKRRATDNASRFLLAQKQEYEGRLAAIENRLAEFKRRNLGLLPGEHQDYFSKLQQATEQRSLARGRLNQLKLQREQIRKQLSGESPVTTLPGGGLTESSADNLQGTGNIVDRRITEAENKLNQMRLQWTDQHPEVIAQRELLARLRAERASYLDALGVKGDSQGPSSIEGNPVYTSLRNALSQVDLKIFELNAELAGHNATISELDRLADTTPGVEAEYQQLNRDYSVMNTEYQEIVKRLETARLSGEADQSENVDFRIIVPASVGAAPVAPKRLLLLPAVFAGALTLGAWVALTISRIRPVMYTMEDVTRATHLPLLGAVGNTSPVRLRQGKRWAVLGFSAVCAVLLLALCITMGIELLNNHSGSGSRLL